METRATLLIALAGFSLSCTTVEAAAPVRLGSEGRQAAAPRVTAAGDLYLARWAPGAPSPSAPVRVNAVPGEAKSSPVIRAQLEVGEDGTVHVLYPANARSPVNGKPVVDVHYARSTDGGRSFSAPVTLNTPSPNDLSASSHSDISAAATFPALTTGPGGRVLAFWLDSRHVADAEDPSDVYAAVSADNGGAWSADKRLFGGQVCECCQPVASRGADAVLLSSRHVDGKGHRDPIVSRVSFDLATIEAPARIGTKQWEIDGCPMKATALAADGEGVYAAWYSQADAPAGVWFAVSEDGGRSFEAGRPLHPDADVADAPVIAVADGGRVIVSWHAKAGGERRVYVAASDDRGRSFTAPVAVSPAQEPAGYPAIAARADTATIAWQQGTAVYAMRWPAK